METWILENADNVTKYDFVPHSFHVLHSHRPIGKRGGGIYVISRNSIRLEAIKFPSHSTFESLTASVFFVTLFVSIGDLPSSKHRQFYRRAHVLSLFPLFSSNFILTGDFNTPNCTSHDNPLSALLRELEQF